MAKATIEVDYSSALSMLESTIDQVTEQHTSLLCAAIALAVPAEARWVEVYLYDPEPWIAAVYDQGGCEIKHGDEDWWNEICITMSRIYHQHAALPITSGPSDHSFRRYDDGISEIYDLRQWREAAVLELAQLSVSQNGRM